jgi:hypothetical protein
MRTTVMLIHAWETLSTFAAIRSPAQLFPAHFAQATTSPRKALAFSGPQHQSVASSHIAGISLDATKLTTHPSCLSTTKMALPASVPPKKNAVM